MENSTQAFNWDTFRKNLKVLRKHFKITQEEIAEKIGISRSSYQYAEAKSATGVIMEAIAFWNNNYGISPNDILMSELNPKKIQNIETRIRFEKMNKRVKVTIKKK